MSKLNRVFRKIINKYNRGRLKNTDFSLISSNCNGALLLHDLGLMFRTPTVNLWFKPDHFIKYLSNIQEYMNSELTFSDNLEEEYGYPVGELGETEKINIFFQHYKTRDEAKTKWCERTKRINLDNLFIMFTDRDGCTYEDLKNFDNLPYKNKVVFTNKIYPDIKSSFYIKGFEDKESVGLCFEFINKHTGRKYYDAFPYIKWFNNIDK